MNKFGLDDDHLDLQDQDDANPNITFVLHPSKDGQVSDLNDEVVFEPVKSESYELSYSCLLIPRFPSHQLKGDLANYLPQWLQQICISYGWRLEFISAEYDYFQWALRVNVSVPPIQFMQAIRYETSKFILSNFGHIAKENLSNDFWAPGHLVVLGTRPHPKEMIAQYIRLTRRNQGLQTL
jgi:REP element-mobilizing transposase RayT